MRNFRGKLWELISTLNILSRWTIGLIWHVSSYVPANSFSVHKCQKEFGLEQSLEQVNFILSSCGLGILKIGMINFSGMHTS